MANTSNPALTALRIRPRASELELAGDAVFRSHAEATVPPPARSAGTASSTTTTTTTLTLVANNRTTQMSSSSSSENTVLERKTQHVSDEQSAVDTLPEGLPLSASDHDLIIDIVSALSGEQPGEDDLANLPTGEGATIDEASLPTRKPFDEEPTRKKHAPKPPPRELTDVSDVHELFKDWNNN